jgi:hypothetical protein
MIFLKEIRFFLDNVEKCGSAGQAATDDCNMAHSL